MADNCETCPSKDGCTSNKENCMIENNPFNAVENIIGVMSGKGGVGKSTISTLIAKQLKKMGYKVGILDADITGPSIPRLLKINEQRARTLESGIIPVETEDGIKAMSLNLLLDQEADPVIWRGPLIAGVVKQFWTDVLWGELDYLIIDLPPGTGDVALTVMQSIPITDFIMVTVPQDLVSMIVAKAVNMAKKMNKEVIGIVENMSYLTCPDCGKRIELFNQGNKKDLLKEMDLEILGTLPMSDTIYKILNNEKDDLETEVVSVIENICKRIIK